MNTFNLPKIPRSIRGLIRNGELTKPTTGMAPGYVQSNLVILPKDLAFDFLLFCKRNPKPCPVIDVVESGLYEPINTAPGADLRVDVAMYSVFKYGELECEVEDITEYWREDFVSFLIGCSFTFESALIKSGISLKHVENATNVSMYVTNIQTERAGVFRGPMVVTMRPIPRNKVDQAIQITARYPAVHGAPIHVGDPSEIGIKNICKPDFGDPVKLIDDEVPVFWACGVTPQAVARNSKPELMITHSPGYMFITDIKDEDLQK